MIESELEYLNSRISILRQQLQEDFNATYRRIAHLEEQMKLILAALEKK